MTVEETAELNARVVLALMRRAGIKELVIPASAMQLEPMGLTLEQLPGGDVRLRDLPHEVASAFFESAGKTKQ
jgi:hypothetical protein